ncbi:MAG: sulfhydryloxidase p33 [Cotesia congregata filamentous virus 2]
MNSNFTFRFNDDLHSTCIKARSSAIHYSTLIMIFIPHRVYLPAYMKSLDDLKALKAQQEEKETEVILKRKKKIKTTIDRIYSEIQVMLYIVNKTYNMSSITDSNEIENNVLNFVFYDFNNKEIKQGLSTKNAFIEYLHVYNKIFTMPNNKIDFYHNNYINFEKYLYHWRVFPCTFMWLFLHYVIGNTNNSNNDTIDNELKKINDIKLFILFNLDYLILCDICKVHYLQNKNILIYELINGTNFEEIINKFHKYINYSIDHEKELIDRSKTIQTLSLVI